MTHDFNPDITEEFEAHYLSRDDLINRWGNAISTFQSLQGLVGFWPMSSVQRSTGNAYDLSAQGRTLTYTGNPVYRNGEFNLLPVIDLDGTGDYLTRADETDLDILGTEAIYANPGVTIGGWFRFAALNTGTPNLQQQLIGKWDDSGANRSYTILNNPDGSNAVLQFLVSLDGGGVNFSSVSSSITPALSTWYFVVGKFTPSSEVAILVNNTEDTNTTAIVASCFNSNASFDIGRYQRVPNYLSSEANLCFLCAVALSDTAINGLFQQTRALFDV